MIRIGFAAYLALLLPLTARAADLVRFDFESGDLQGWRVVEGQFDYLVSDRTVYHNVYPGLPSQEYNKQGKYYLSTVEQQPGKPSNDAMTGVVESPVFVLAGPEISMLVGAATLPKSYVALCTLDGREVRTARGKVDTEVMQRVTWNAPELVGQKVFLRIVDRESAGWGHVTFDDFTASGRIDPDATRKHFAGVGERLARQRREVVLKQHNTSGLRAAIEDLIKKFAARYPRGPQFLARLADIEEQLTAEALQPDALNKLLADLESLRREALVANPLVSGQPILYVVRHQYQSHYHAIDTLFSSDELNADRGMTPHSALFQGPGALKTIDPATGKTTTLLQTPGVVRDPEVHFDGRKIVFALRRSAQEDYHIWEIQADGAGPRQLTSARNVADFDPFYMPDDHIAFSSTREPKYNQCSRDVGANLFRMEPDGANIHQIGKNNLFDNHGTLTPDGRILYARWEYVDRNFGDAHGIWTVNPDGTNQAIYWGNNTASPGGIYYPRLIPGTDRLMCIFGMHHFRLWGALAILDRRLGLDGREPVLRIWPESAMGLVRAGGPFDCDSFNGVHPKYESPWPLSDKYFLCSRMTGHDEAMGIYLLDLFGNEILLHHEAPGCFDPIPLAPRPRPAVIPPRRDYENNEGYFYVADVYRGTHMQGVRRGDVKMLRIVEVPEKRHWSPGAWFGQGYTAPGMNWHSLEAKRILGTVPVEADGSAYFVIPSEKFVYFQLLDGNGMMIQSMRSGASVQSGERAACTGCHEERRSAPPTQPGVSMALQRSPSRIANWYGPPRAFSFTAEVQPVFDRHCVACHDYGKEPGKKLNLAGDRGLTFNTAYVEIWRKGYIRSVGAGPAEVQPAYSWGSHASKLVQAIRDKTPGHEKLTLSPEEFDRIATWVDINGVYYPTYSSTYCDSLTGRCPLDDGQLGRLSQLTGWRFADQRSFNASPGPDVCFERPELSPCLAGLPKGDARYVEALKIIEAGRAALAQRPREDMPGMQPSPADARREEKYAQRRQIELRNREALRGGGKVYDEDWSEKAE